MDLVERSEIDELNELADRLGAKDPYSYSDPESIKGLVRLKNKTDSALARAVVSFEESGEWAADGARSAVGWMAKECGLPTNEGKAQLRRGRLLEQAPLVAAAHRAGDIGAAQVDVLVRAQRTAAALFERDEALLVEQAKALTASQFDRAVEYWKQFADPDGAEEAEFARAERRDVWLVPGPTGMYLGKMNMDPVSGKIYSDELGRLGRILFDADWAEAKERLGRDPTLSELRRTPAHRRSDAATEMAARSASMPADAQRPVPLFSILVDYSTISGVVSGTIPGANSGTISGRICQIEGGPVISPGSLLHHMEHAEFERIVFKPKGRIECSEKSRFFLGGTRRAIEVRDRECGNPYCETPAKRCEIDHIIPYSKGGLTTQENARVLCGPCNRMRNVAEPPWAQPGSPHEWPDPMVGPDPPGG
jgi:Domain of unknown function (DUF222)/HNH endonuclease